MSGPMTVRVVVWDFEDNEVSALNTAPCNRAQWDAMTAAARTCVKREIIRDTFGRILGIDVDPDDIPQD